MSSTESKEKSHHARWPSPEWRAAFRDQATSELLKAANRCAATEIARLRRHDVQIGHDADDLVQAVLTATCDGVLTWRPEVVSLRTHVHDGIRHACRHAYRRHRGRAPELIALDHLAPEDGIWTEVEDAMSSRATETDHELVDLARRLTSELQSHAAGDVAALSVLDALAQGLTGDLEIAEATALNVGAVDAAKNRLKRLGKLVTPELRADIMGRLRSSSDPIAAVDERARTGEPVTRAPGSGAARVFRRAIKDLERVNGRRKIAR